MNVNEEAKELLPSASEDICGKPVSLAGTTPEPEGIAWSGLMRISVDVSEQTKVSSSFVCLRQPGHDGECMALKVLYKDLVQLAKAFEEEIK
jgi:hypothetical protein